MSETSAGETGEREASGTWFGPEPITDEQIATLRRDLEHPLSLNWGSFAPFVVRKLLAEVERLNTVLDANRVVRNAAESSSRTYRGAMELLKTQRTQLRAERDAAILRAETAERALAEMRERIAEEISEVAERYKRRAEDADRSDPAGRLVLVVKGEACASVAEWIREERHDIPDCEATDG